MKSHNMDGEIPYYCEWCGKVFWASVATTQVYCSSKCYWESRSSGKEKPPKGKICATEEETIGRK
jgi:hypothetical protein